MFINSITAESNISQGVSSTLVTWSSPMGAFAPLPGFSHHWNFLLALASFLLLGLIGDFGSDSIPICFCFPVS